MPIANRVRYVNKRFTNRIMGKIAGKAHSPIAQLTHVGRVSGKTYTIPIMVEPRQNGFLFALTYGPEVDWYKNVLAAGSCRLAFHGKDYMLVEPIKLPKEEGLLAFPNPQGFILKRLAIQDFLFMKIKE